MKQKVTVGKVNSKSQRLFPCISVTSYFSSSCHSVPVTENLIQVEPSTNRREASLDSDLAALIEAGNAFPNFFLKRRGQDKAAYRNISISFVHYPKSGGTTIKDCLIKMASKAGKPDPVLVFAKNVANTKEQMLNGELEKAEIFMGTNGFTLCEYLHPKRCAYFTMLRDPYDRMVSHYYFCKDGGESNAPCQQSIEKFALLVRSIFLHQMASGVNKCEQDSRLKWSCASKRLSLDKLVDSNSTKEEMVLNYLERKLVDTFAVVGLLEEYETSLALLQEALGLPFYDECITEFSNSKINNTDQRALERIASKKKLLENEDVRKALDADIRLYRKAKELFEKQKERSRRYWKN